MRRLTHIALGSLVLALSSAGCADFLSGPGLTENPNQPTTATRDLLFGAVQASQVTQFEGLPARLANMWMQQLAGIGRQHKTMGQYTVTEGDVSAYFTRLYTGGGLVDMRKVQALAEAAGDSVYSGIAKVYEAHAFGMGASLWGDLPYSEAVNPAFPTPRLDPQEQVYATVQAKLDTAIAFLAATGPTNFGPGSVDLVHAGDRTKWTEAARTLKARFYLHLAERDPANYARALAQAQQGISVAPAPLTATSTQVNFGANDFRTFHSTASTEWNIWYQFLVIQRTGDVGAGGFLVNLLTTRGDPRLPMYFAPATDGVIRGADPNGDSPNPVSNLAATRIAQNFRQPLITWVENQLVIAEAAFRGGDELTARSALNAVRTNHNMSTFDPTLTGPALLQEIMLEKYMALFQNIEAWNDYKRTCLPVFPSLPTGQTALPGRLLYGEAERNTNPNIPAPSDQPARNWNDPTACT